MIDRAFITTPGLDKMISVLSIPVCRQAGVFGDLNLFGIWCLEF